MKKKILFSFLIVLLLVILIPYAVVEFQTALHGEEVKNGYEQTSMIDGDNYYKVFQYTDDACQVLYSSTENINICRFVKNENDEWILDSWSTVYSKTGSADSFTFPFYPLKKE